MTYIGSASDSQPQRHNKTQIKARLDQIVASGHQFNSIKTYVVIKKCTSFPMTYTNHEPLSDASHN